MDIDDILREVDPIVDTIPHETRDLQALTRAWVAERCAPELLEYDMTATNNNLLPPQADQDSRVDGQPMVCLSASTNESRRRSRKLKN